MLARRLPGPTGPWHSLAAVAAVAALVVPAMASRPTVAAPSSTRTVTYRGYTFQVPRSWQVVRLDPSGRTCVRFDVHAVYLGTPPANESCPSQLVGTTQALLVAPAGDSSDPSSTENPVARQITVDAPRITITATYDSDPGQVSQILTSASLPKPAVHDPDPTAATMAESDASAVVPMTASAVRLASAAARAAAPAAALAHAAINYKGLGFDACTAPSTGYMSAWHADSPYRAIGVYIGGSDEACAQPNLTKKWLKTESAAGWHFMPMYVGPQAEFGELGAHPGHQARAAANDAVAQAERLGFPAGTPLYYDMEAYPPSDNAKALRFLTSWDSRLNELGYASGIYSSSSAAVTALAEQYYTGKYTLPDVIFDALWNGEENTADPVLSSKEWDDHRRVHQFSGNVAQSYGGDEINIDQDYLNVDLPASVPAAP
jgi:hypothetical protein